MIGASERLLPRGELPFQLHGDGFCSGADLDH